MKVSIYDVARQAGVSKSTVSRVLTGQAGVQVETRLRVEKAIQALGYHPNALARGLIRGRTSMLGLVVLGLDNPFFGLLAQGVEMAARARGYNVLIAINELANREREQACLASLLERQIDGALVVPVGIAEADLLVLQQTGAKIVLLNASDGQNILSSVGGDNRQGGYLAINHLLDLGHRRVAVLGYNDYLPSNRERLEGYHLAHRQRIIDVDPQLVMADLQSVEMVSEAVHTLLALPDPPTALFAINDDVAIAALQALTFHGCRVPEEMALVGYDDLPVSSWLSVPLTTVAQPKEEMGRVGANLLIDQIERPDTSLQRVLLTPRLVIRRSCGQRIKEHEKML